jgi:glutamate N-acetyltransferase / amino-acid N-acetyltransferase
MAKIEQEVKKGVTVPEGFLASGIHCGIKKGKKKDLSLVFSKIPCVASATFTTNQVKSYSLMLSMKRIKNDIHAVVINSGNANTANGENSYRYTKKLTGELAGKLGIKETSVLIASTGIIGKPLPHEKISASLEKLIENLGENGETAARGIMTTDRKIKQAAVNTGITGRKKEVFIGGMVKGAGMINPCMATLLGFFTTDAVIKKEALDSALKEAVQDSFNMINIDGDTSTNDMIVCLANGAAKNSRIHRETENYKKFAGALKNICRHLAKKIASDGEGAEKLIEVTVRGAWSKKDARRTAKKVAGSNLVKTAIAGSQPNWGRIISSVGSSRIKLNPRDLRILICGIEIFRGNPVRYNKSKLIKALQNQNIAIEIDLQKGKFSAVGWGCDLTEEYVKINKEY